MTLVDNVRDDNYYEFPAAPTYIAGFFSSQINELLDRNVMTIDAFDWAHRTTANPPDATTTICAPVVRPGRISTRAPSRTSTSTCSSTTKTPTRSAGSTRVCRTSPRRWSATSTRPRPSSTRGPTVTSTATRASARSRRPTTRIRVTAAVPRTPSPCGVTRTRATAILADYGEAYSFMLFLYDRYGIGFMSTLHRDGNAQGLVGLQHALDGYANGADVYQVLHDFQVSTLVDSASTPPRARSTGSRPGSRRRASTRRSTWTTRRPTPSRAPAQRR